MKVTAFVGSARKMHTYNAARSLLEKLQSYGNVEYEIVRLIDYDLKPCRGCKLCCDKGEELCPLKDDRDKLLDKLAESDGVIFASPNYSFQVSALMKLFLDRLAFLYHRPRLFGKAFTSIVAQGMHGGKDIVKYLDLIGSMLGYNVVKGCVITTLEPMTEKGKAEIDRIIEKQSRKFHATLMKREYPSPSLFKLMLFRMSRTSLRLMLDDSFKDPVYYREKGWSESDYFYPVKLNVFKRLLGWFFDIMAVRMTKRR